MGLRRGSYPEAFKLDGRRLADTDSRWPINVASDFGPYDPADNTYLDGQVVVADVDGQPGAEVVNLVDQVPYPYGGFGTYLGGCSRSLRIEVLKIR